MAVPRKRKSHSRRRQQRSHDALSVTNTSKCNNCSAPKIPHRVCPACGWHAGRQVIEVQTD